MVRQRQFSSPRPWPGKVPVFPGTPTPRATERMDRVSRIVHGRNRRAAFRTFSKGSYSRFWHADHPHLAVAWCEPSGGIRSPGGIAHSPANLTLLRWKSVAVILHGSKHHARRVFSVQSSGDGRVGEVEPSPVHRLKMAMRFDIFLEMFPFIFRNPVELIDDFVDFPVNRSCPCLDG